LYTCLLSVLHTKYNYILSYCQLFYSAKKTQKIKNERDFKKSVHVIVFISYVPVFIQDVTVITGFAFIKGKQHNDDINFDLSKEGRVMEKFLQKLIEGMEYYAKSYTISGNQNLSRHTSSQSSSNKKRD
jgi:hypothetical protein